MKRRVALAVACCAVVMGGCAKKDIVRKDEAISAAKPTAVAKQYPETETAKTEAIKPKTGTASLSKEETPQITPIQDTARLSSELQKIYFSFDSATLSLSARETLVKNAAVIKGSKAKVTIEGNCDERGSDEYNLALGDRRAKAAKKYLTTLGVPADRVATVSYGKEKPTDPGHDENAWAKNRRDDFIAAH